MHEIRALPQALQRIQKLRFPDTDHSTYANRDSLSTRVYRLDNIPTLLRGTLRKAGYCAAWDVFVQLGCTDDSFRMELANDATWSDYLDSFLPANTVLDTRANLAHQLNLEPNGEVMAKLDWLGIFGKTPIGVTGPSPAATLQTCWRRNGITPHRQGLVVMWHVSCITRTQTHEIQAHLTVEGLDDRNTAMAKTVGLPVAIAAKMILNGTIKERGVLLPLIPSLYDPILNELETLGVVFNEVEIN